MHEVSFLCLSEPALLRWPGPASDDVNAHGLGGCCKGKGIFAGRSPSTVCICAGRPFVLKCRVKVFSSEAGHSTCNLLLILHLAFRLVALTTAADPAIAMLVSCSPGPAFQHPDPDSLCERSRRSVVFAPESPNLCHREH